MTRSVEVRKALKRIGRASDRWDAQRMSGRLTCKSPFGSRVAARATLAAWGLNEIEFRSLLEPQA